MIPSYGKVWALGNRETAGLFGEFVTVQEKVDGSQFSFRRVGDVLHVKSKSVLMPAEDMLSNKMFAPAVQHLLDRMGDIAQDHIYRGEVLTKPKHNTLAYDRTPRGFIALFDVEVFKDNVWNFLPPQLVGLAATILGLDVVPTFGEKLLGSASDVHDLLATESFLGGPTIEGVVVKAYDKRDSFGHLLKGKYVSEAFKEKHSTDWKDRNPTGRDFSEQLAATYGSKARWEKAVQALRDQGVLEDDPRDIGKLIPYIREDIEKECKEEISAALYKQWNAGAGRKVTAGFPEWYKRRLLDTAFEPWMVAA